MISFYNLVILLVLLLNLVIYNLITCVNVNEGNIYFEKRKIIENNTTNANTN